MMGPIILFIQLRIVLRVIKIRRTVQDKVTKTGVTLILWSVVFTLLRWLTTGVYSLTVAQNNLAIVIILNLLIFCEDVTILITAYLGWILPNWLKRKIRGRAWIVQMKENIKIKEITYPHSVSKAMQSERKKIIEVVER